MEALTQIAAQLGLDASFYYLFAMMVVLYALLSVVYLRPFQHLLHDRKEKTEGAQKQAAELRVKAEREHENYKARLKDVNDKARAALRDSEAAAKKEESRILGEAVNKAKASLQETQKELATQRKAVIDALSTEISGIAADVATKIMGRR